jgi:MoxR-like ATPase
MRLNIKARGRLFVYGPAKSGKTSFAKEFAELCEKYGIDVRAHDDDLAEQAGKSWVGQEKAGLSVVTKTVRTPTVAA